MLPAILVYCCACLLSPARCDYSSGDDDANLSFFLPGEDGVVRGGNNTIRSGHSLPTLSSWPLRQHWTLPRPNISGFSCRPPPTPPPPPPPLHWRIVLGLNWKFSGEIFKNLHKKGQILILGQIGKWKNRNCWLLYFRELVGSHFTASFLADYINKYCIKKKVESTLKYFQQFWHPLRLWVMLEVTAVIYHLLLVIIRLVYQLYPLWWGDSSSVSTTSHHQSSL